MRNTLLTSVTLAGLVCALPALAQTADSPWAHQPGTGQSGPASSAASNLGPADAQSAIAPHLPAPAQGENASPEAYLRDAQNALMRRQTGLAQQALEMAETRLLDRSTLASQANQPDANPEVRAVDQALAALGRHDLQRAQAAINAALTSAPRGMVTD